MKLANRMLGIVVSLLLVTAGSDAAELMVLSWNVEGGGASRQDPTQGADAKTIAKQLADDFDGFQLVGLCEVEPQHAQAYAKALGADEGGTWWFILGKTGDQDRLMVAYDRDRLELLEIREWNELSFGGSVRGPLMTRFRDRDSGVEFWFVMNHLARGKAWKREEAAKTLNAWAGKQSLPVILAGDLNLDWNLRTQSPPSGRKGFDLMTKDNRLEWVRPRDLKRTSYTQRSNSNPAPRFNSVLDFFFINDDAKRLAPEAWIIERRGDFPDDHRTSDHRPIGARLRLGR
ncbi:Endonuclease/Exonuclease/phosphatase family protein [Planctomycetes bacterium Pan216]|uniref:Endonuclease/Exonuclease/phosphatase family protein n=1 Tax=Kolteria novifilia TaxID=2527975 RepID=A0A518B1M3_9BACT|nr:Endonuclease/Exonuclease/phosphatase family protein [Planctomycetes bacterium Pan216]